MGGWSCSALRPSVPTSARRSRRTTCGGTPREKAFVHEEGCYAERDIKLETGTTVATVDPGASRVTLDDGRELR
jgi:NADPH-dependent 2,4-dienoyl-CoA reductase/sulfur reductase-like enzyme